MKVDNWHIHHKVGNNTDQIDQIYTIVDFGDGCFKKYSIHFQYPMMGNRYIPIVSNNYEDAKYFIVQSASGYRDNTGVPVWNSFDGFIFETPELEYVTESFDDAKRYIEEFILEFLFSGYFESFSCTTEEAIKQKLGTKHLI